MIIFYTIILVLYIFEYCSTIALMYMRLPPLYKLLRRQSKLAEKKAAVAITPGANFDFS